MQIDGKCKKVQKYKFKKKYSGARYKLKTKWSKSAKDQKTQK